MDRCKYYTRRKIGYLLYDWNSDKKKNGHILNSRLPNLHVLHTVVCTPMKIRHAGRKQLEAYSVKLDDCTVILSGIPERVISPNEMNYSFLQTGPNLAPTIELGWETG